MGTARQGLRDFSRPRPGITLSLSRLLPARTAWTYLRSQCKQSTGPSGPFWNVLVYSVDDESSCQRSHTDEFSVFFFLFFFQAPELPDPRERGKSAAIEEISSLVVFRITVMPN